MEVNGKDPVVVDKVVELLGAGYSIRNVANELKIDSGLIVSISKRQPVKKRIRELKKEEKKKLKKNVATVVKNEDNAMSEKSESVVSVKRTKNDLSDDEKITIIDLYNGGKTADELAEKYNCSRWTVYGLAKEFGIMKNGSKSAERKKNLKLKKQEAIILKQEEEEQMAEVNGAVSEEAPVSDLPKVHKPVKKKIVIVSGDTTIPSPGIKKEEIFTEGPSRALKDETSVNTLKSSINRFLVSESLYKCGLCSNRHESMPVNTFVFDREIRSYDLQRKEDRINEACNFIDTVIPFKDGLPTKKLYLYATGNQILFQAVIMACMRKKVNLIVCHYYEVGDGKFDYDNMDMEFGFPDLALSSTPDFINGLNNKFSSIYVSDTTSIEELNSLDTFYILKEVQYNEPNSSSNPESNGNVVVTCYSNIADCMVDYSKYVEEFAKIDRRRNKEYKGVFIHPVVCRGNNRLLSSALTKSFNFLSK